MTRFSTLFFRNAAVLVMVVLVMGLALPYSQSVMAATTRSDDFNRCTLDASFWTFDNPADIPGASPVIVGAYSGDATLQMTVPPGASYTFSTSNTDAPVIWHAVNDANLDYEVKFRAPMNEATDSWKIMGILVRDNTQTAAPKYFRFDYDSRNDKLNQYVAYLEPAANKMTHIIDATGPKDLPGANLTTGDLYLRVQYNKATTQWTVNYRGITANNTQVFNVTDSFTGSTHNPNFTITDIGLFVGSTGTNAPGHTMVVDYFIDMTDPDFAVANDDAVTLTVQKAGTGTGEVNQTCGNGETVNLTAVPGQGSSFGGWGGDASGASPTTSVTMNASKTVIATFNTGGGVVYTDFLYLPLIAR